MIYVVFILRSVALNSFEFEGQLVQFNEELERISTKYKIININSSECTHIGEFEVSNHCFSF
jgi:glutaredoxin-related protein